MRKTWAVPACLLLFFAFFFFRAAAHNHFAMLPAVYLYLSFPAYMNLPLSACLLYASLHS